MEINIDFTCRESVIHVVSLLIYFFCSVENWLHRKRRISFVRMNIYNIYIRLLFFENSTGMNLCNI